MKNAKTVSVVCVVLITLIFSFFNFDVLANETISVFLNNEKVLFDVAPIIVNQRTMVPMRAIFEKLGATVEWDGSINTASAQKDFDTVHITIGSPYMIYNYSRPILLDAPAFAESGRILVPLRAVSEAFGCEVQWDAQTNTVNIFSKDFIDYSQMTSVQQTVEVADVTELLNSIGDNKRIVLTADYYNLSDAEDVCNTCVERESYLDGAYVTGGYVIKNVVNMTIEGSAEIAVDDINANVLSFENCGDIVLKGLTVGHTEYYDQYKCEGSVTKFSNCKNISIENCNLYGCGAIGVSTDNVKGLMIKNCNIYDCSYCALLLLGSDNVQVSETNIYDSSYFGGMCCITGSQVEFERCVVRDNIIPDNAIEGFIVVNDWENTPSELIWKNCTFTNNKFDIITTMSAKNIIFDDCIFTNNTGDMEQPNVTYVNCDIK